MGLSWPGDPGWQLEPAGNRRPRGMVIQGRITVRPGQNPAYRPSAHLRLLHFESVGLSLAALPGKTNFFPDTSISIAICRFVMCQPGSAKKSIAPFPNAFVWCPFSFSKNFRRGNEFFWSALNIWIVSALRDCANSLKIHSEKCTGEPVGAFTRKSRFAHWPVISACFLDPARPSR